MGNSEKKIITAEHLQIYLKSLCVVSEPSVDKIIIGNPTTEINKVGTAWMGYFSTIKEAYEKGINVLVVHEPSFYSHLDLDGISKEYCWAQEQLGLEVGKKEYKKSVEQKKKWILDHNMVIIRCHDVMDKIEGFGMPFALGKALGYENTDIIRSTTFFNVYKIETDKAINVVKEIAKKLKFINQQGVAFYGDENYQVSSIGVGTGCFCDPIQYMELRADLNIAIDDSIRTWVQTTYAQDSGKPLVVINHGTAEEMGMVLLNEYLEANVSYISFTHFIQGCGYKWIEG